MDIATVKIAVIGQGYVGLPLAIEFGKQFPPLGFDINSKRIQELKNGKDHTKEASEAQLSSAPHLVFSDDPTDLAGNNVFIVTVPTPLDEFKTPDLGPVREASSMLGAILQKGAIVIYESTVFPGCTEEVCVPILARESGLTFNKDFYCGYSPPGGYW